MYYVCTYIHMYYQNVAICMLFRLKNCKYFHGSLYKHNKTVQLSFIIILISGCTVICTLLYQQWYHMYVHIRSSIYLLLMYMYTYVHTMGKPHWVDFLANYICIYVCIPSDNYIITYVYHKFKVTVCKILMGGNFDKWASGKFWWNFFWWIP